MTAGRGTALVYTQEVSQQLVINLSSETAIVSNSTLKVMLCCI